jgi:DNA-binding beta-propeller fold protein YncE
MYPYGITIDAMNTIFVADMMNNRIQEFTAEGAYITQFGTYGVNNGQFQSPVGVTVDTEGNLLVVDTGGGRIEKFSRTFSAPTTFKCGSVYHYQAFAINANATVYGNDVTFSTMNCSARPNLAAAAANTIPKPIASPVLPTTGIPKK